MGIKPTIFGQDFRDHQERFSKGLDTQLGTTFDRVFEFLQVAGEGHLERTSTRNDGLVFNGILDGTKTITDGVVNLNNSVRVGSFFDDS